MSASRKRSSLSPHPYGKRHQFDTPCSEKHSGFPEPFFLQNSTDLASSHPFHLLKIQSSGTPSEHGRIGNNGLSGSSTSYTECDQSLHRGVSPLSPIFENDDEPDDESDDELDDEHEVLNVGDTKSGQPSESSLSTSASGLSSSDDSSTDERLDRIQQLIDYNTARIERYPNSIPRRVERFTLHINHPGIALLREVNDSRIATLILIAPDREVYELGQPDFSIPDVGIDPHWWAEEGMDRSKIRAGPLADDEDIRKQRIAIQRQETRARNRNKRGERTQAEKIIDEKLAEGVRRQKEGKKMYDDESSNKSSNNTSDGGEGIESSTHSSRSEFSTRHSESSTSSEDSLPINRGRRAPGVQATATRGQPDTESEPSTLPSEPNFPAPARQLDPSTEPSSSSTSSEDGPPIKRGVRKPRSDALKSGHVPEPESEPQSQASTRNSSSNSSYFPSESDFGDSHVQAAVSGHDDPSDGSWEQRVPERLQSSKEGSSSEERNSEGDDDEVDDDGADRDKEGEDKGGKNKEPDDKENGHEEDGIEESDDHQSSSSEDEFPPPPPQPVVITRSGRVSHPPVRYVP